MTDKLIPLFRIKPLDSTRAIIKFKGSINEDDKILDEIIDSALDHNAIDNFLSLINNMDDNTSVFVISPKGDIYNDKF